MGRGGGAVVSTCMQPRVVRGGVRAPVGRGGRRGEHLHAAASRPRRSARTSASPLAASCASLSSAIRLARAASASDAHAAASIFMGALSFMGLRSSAVPVPAGGGGGGGGRGGSHGMEAITSCATRCGPSRERRASSSAGGSSGGRGGIPRRSEAAVLPPLLVVVVASAAVGAPSVLTRFGPAANALSPPSVPSAVARLALPLPSAALDTALDTALSGAPRSPPPSCGGGSVPISLYRCLSCSFAPRWRSAVASSSSTARSSRARVVLSRVSSAARRDCCALAT